MAIGEKIQKLRKQQGLSQEALAEKVTVTRQTISKWELGQSTPDLDFVAQLSDIFSVTADYLIKEDRTEPDEPPCKKRQYRLSERGKGIVLALFSAAALSAVCICLICDYFTSERLSWSMIAAAAMAAVWLVLLPSLTARRKIILKTLFAVSAVPIPLLAILALLLDRPLIFTMGACIALVSILAVWAIYGIFRKCRKNLWRAVGCALLVMIPVPIAILYIVSGFLQETPRDVTSFVFNSGITLVLSLGCFGMDGLRSRRKEETRK
ncbi:MAG: helix-turn-helix transcriptional regulator [Eubacteriales bacterium]|nr:helix-turn-helix transcriptional regulator [Eubacteriales bacterium]